MAYNTATEFGMAQRLKALGIDVTLSTDGNQKLGLYGSSPVSQPSHITNASESHALNATFDDTEVEAALNALGGKINAIISALESVGITASS